MNPAYAALSLSLVRVVGSASCSFANKVWLRLPLFISFFSAEDDHMSTCHHTV